MAVLLNEPRFAIISDAFDLLKYAFRCITRAKESGMRIPTQYETDEADDG